MLCDINPCQARPLDRRPIGDGARGGTVAVDAVRPRAEYSHFLAGDLLCAVEGKVLVAPAGAAGIPDLYRNLAAADNARAGNLALQAADAIKQIISGFRIVPIVARAINLHGEAAFCRGRRRGAFGGRTRKYGPPPRARKSRVILLGRLLESMAIEQLPRRSREFLEHVVVARD